MELSFGLEISSQVNKQVKHFINLQNALNGYILNNNYGEDLEIIYVGCICVSEEFESSKKLKRPRYNRAEKYYEMSIIFDYDLVINMEEYELKNYISLLMLPALVEVLTGNKKNITFQSEKFLEDLKLALESEGLLVEQDIISESKTYPDLDDNTKLEYTILNNQKEIEKLILCNELAINFDNISKTGGSNKDFKNAITSILVKFNNSNVSWDSEDLDNICTMIEDIMNLVGLESSDGILNSWRYGFDPSGFNGN